MKDFRFDLQRFADGDADDKGGATDGGGKPEEKTEKTFTQAELEDIIKKRLARERKDWEAKLEEERKKANMDEVERLKNEKAEAEKKAQETASKAVQRLILAEAKVQAVALGVKPERVDYAVKLADLSEAVTQDGEPDAKAIKVALEAVLKDLPELKGASGSVGTGTNPGETKLQDNPWRKETFNLTKQAEILRKDPALAERLKAEAKG